MKLYFVISILLIFSLSCGRKPDVKHGNSIPPSLEQQIQNQTAFTKLYGYIRYFHPSSETQGINWEKIAVFGSAYVKKALNSSELVLLLNEFFIPLAPSVKIYLSNNFPVLNVKDLIPADTIGTIQIFSQHFGVQLDINTNYKLYYSKIGSFDPSDTVFGKLEKYPKAGEYYTYKLNESLSASFPLALFQKDNKTFPPADIDKFKTLFSSLDEFQDVYDVSKPEFRFGYIAITWNIFQHFYPYFDVVKTNWDNTLNEALSETISDSSEIQFSETLKKIIADLHDGHGYMNSKETEAIYAPSFDWEWLENKLVVTKVIDSTLNVSVGDIIEEIDGIASINALENIESRVSGATTGWKRVKVNSRFYNSSTYGVLLGKKNTIVKLKITDSKNKVRELELNRSLMLNSSNEIDKPDSFSEIKKGIVYVNLSISPMEDINKNMSKLESAKGIIFDLRGYPKGNHEIIQHLIDTNVNSAIWCIPFTVFPDRKNVQFDLPDRWDMPPLKPRLKAKIVFLINAKAISYSESIMGIIEAYKLAEIIGEPTAGTNGNMNTYTFSNGYSLRFTGMKVLKHDGSQHHAIGIQPTITVSPTIKGFLVGKDEQLDKAIEILNK